ncbi:MAG: OmpH family outer membrane protein [Deltaproteobacteria bacterium]|nr:OmpH family outer membrane protein [Deltaproteobacteria bacterium]
MGKGRELWMAAVVAAALLFAGGAFAEGLKVAVIDVNKILNESEAGKTAKKKIESRYEELKKKVEEKQEEAKKIKDEIDKQKIILGKEKLKEKEDALNGKIAELRQLTQEAEKEMQSRQGELTQEVLKSVKAQLDKFVGKEKIDLVLDQTQGGVVHFSPSLDITAKVLELVNKEKLGGK